MKPPLPQGGKTMKLGVVALAYKLKHSVGQGLGYIMRPE